MTKSKKTEDFEQQVGELTADLQRMRADFENYRKRVEGEKSVAQHLGETKAVLKLLPVIDTIERAIQSVPADLAENQWVKGIVGVEKQLGKQLEGLKIVKIDAKPGVEFNPELHQAIQFDEDSEGDTEVIAKELQPGYLMDGGVIRHAMVKVARK